MVYIFIGQVDSVKIVLRVSKPPNNLWYHKAERQEFRLSLSSFNCGRTAPSDRKVVYYPQLQRSGGRKGPNNRNIFYQSGSRGSSRDRSTCMYEPIPKAQRRLGSPSRHTASRSPPQSVVQPHVAVETHGSGIRGRYNRGSNRGRCTWIHVPESITSREHLALISQTTAVADKCDTQRAPSDRSRAGTHARTIVLCEASQGAADRPGHTHPPLSRQLNA